MPLCGRELYWVIHPPGVTAEVWFRNPKFYIRECVELLANLVAWDRGYLVKNRVDAEKFGNLYYPTSIEYRMLLVGDQGTAEVRRGHPIGHPVAVYPTWVYGEDDLSVLEDWLANPVGEDDRACSDKRFPLDERPVLGQEHRVVITNVPSAAFVSTRQFYSLLSELQQEHPEAIIHVHNLYSFRVAFGGTFGAVDIDPRLLASKGKVVMPNGKECVYETAQRMPQWVEVVGFKPSDLVEPRQRCMYNMRSAQWAAAHFKENLKFRTRGDSTVDPKAVSAPTPVTLTPFSSHAPALAGDKILCDSCSLAPTCKFYRDGSVCTLPGTEGSKLAKSFETRDSNNIIDALGQLLSLQVDRLEMGRRIEEEFGELSPEVTKIIDGLFDRGQSLAKLINPNLGVRPSGMGGLMGAPIQVGSSETPQEQAARAIAALEDRGYARDEITPALIQAIMAGEPVPPKVLALPPVPSA